MRRQRTPALLQEPCTCVSCAPSLPPWRPRVTVGTCARRPLSSYYTCLCHSFCALSPASARDHRRWSIAILLLRGATFTERSCTPRTFLFEISSSLKRTYPSFTRILMLPLLNGLSLRYAFMEGPPTFWRNSLLILVVSSFVRYVQKSAIPVICARPVPEPLKVPIPSTFPLRYPLIGSILSQSCLRLIPSRRTPRR